jgi:SpoIID/LytB domain protein
LDVKNLEINKQKVIVEKNKIAVIKKDMETRFGFLATELKKAEAYKAKLTQDLLNLEAQRINSLNLPKNASSTMMCSDDRKIDPGFGTGFAFFTFGIPHHVGINQYGALGRAKAGQSAEDIIRAYYQNIEIVGGKEGQTVKVNGKNEFGQSFNNESMNIEEYLKHIYEMPTSWPEAALQAQVMAARSYALRVYSEKGWLAPSQADQVIKKELNNERWIAAVNATKGKIISSDGKPIKAWFASTAGGYTFTSADVWGGQTSWTKRVRDTNGDINSFDDLFAKAYDKDSPCFYSAQGYRKEYNKSAWLKPGEVADITNAILLGQKDSSTQGHLCRIDIPGGCCVKNGGECKYVVWDVEKVKTELRNRGVNPFSSINSVNISDWNKNEGRVNTISLSGDSGSLNFDGSTFKSYFNSRAPANISIVGPLYNVEKR